MLADNYIKVLDHGFVGLVDHKLGDDIIANAARLSYGNGTTKVRKDDTLIPYLWEHEHTSPFEMCEAWFHVKLPLYIARQIVRHRTASLNEVSARYSEVADEFYIPEIGRFNTQNTLNKQMSSKDVVGDPDSMRDMYIASCSLAYTNYKTMVDGGLAREVARGVLPQCIYTEWVWKIDLKNLLHFLKLRLDSHAQYEAQVYAQAKYDLVAPFIPQTIKAFENHTLNGKRFSQEEMSIIIDCMDLGKLSEKLSATTKSSRWQSSLLGKFK